MLYSRSSKVVNQGDVGSKTTWGLEARDAILSYEEARKAGDGWIHHGDTKGTEEVNKVLRGLLGL